MNGKPNDCQNFASQCFWAGLGGESKQLSTTRPTLPPVVRDATYGSTYPQIWQHNNYYINGPYGYGWNWDNVNAFAYYMKQSSINAEGPCGNTIFGNISTVQAGEEIAYSDTISPTFGLLNHAIFVTSVTGTYGSRGVSNLFVAAHSGESTSAYEPLTSYKPNTSASHFSNIYVLSGHYGIEQ